MKKITRTAVLAALFLGAVTCLVHAEEETEIETIIEETESEKETTETFKEVDPEETVSESVPGAAESDIMMLDSGVRFSYRDDGTVQLEGLSVYKDVDVKLPDMINKIEVTSIADYAFYMNYNIKNIRVPRMVKDIGINPFAGIGAENITVDSFNETFNSLNGVLFRQVTDFLVAYPGGRTDKEYTLPDDAKVICSSAFMGNPYLESVNLPDGLLEIRSDAFRSCINLKELTIPAKVARIGNNPFASTAISAFQVAEKNAAYISDGGVLMNRAKTELIAFPSGSAETVYILPDTILSVNVGAFSGCKNLQQITLPEQLIEIGASAFQMCSSLSEITLPSGIKEIPSWAFYACYNLRKMNIPEGVTNIDQGAFAYCQSLEDIVLPESLNEIGDSAFSGCSELMTVRIPASVQYMGSDVFSNCTYLRLEVSSGSYAEEWAIENHVPYRIIQ